MSSNSKSRSLFKKLRRSSIRKEDKSTPGTPDNVGTGNNLAELTPSIPAGGASSGLPSIFKKASRSRRKSAPVMMHSGSVNTQSSDSSSSGNTAKPSLTVSSGDGLADKPPSQGTSLDLSWTQYSNPASLEESTLSEHSSIQSGGFPLNFVAVDNSHELTGDAKVGPSHSALQDSAADTSVGSARTPKQAATTKSTMATQQDQQPSFLPPPSTTPSLFVTTRQNSKQESMADLSSASSTTKVKTSPSGTSGKQTDAAATPADDDASFMRAQKQPTTVTPLASTTVEVKTVEVVPTTPTSSTGLSFASSSVSFVSAAGTAPATGQSPRKPDSRRKQPAPGGTPTRPKPITHASSPSLSRRDGSTSNGQNIYTAATGILTASHKRQHSSSSLHHYHHHHHGSGGTFSIIPGGASHNGNNNNESNVLPIIDAFAPLLYRTGSRVWEDIQETKGTGHVKRTSSSTKMYILGAGEESSNSSSEGEEEEDYDDDGESKKNKSRPSSISSKRRRKGRITPGGGSRGEDWQRKSLEEYNPLNYQTPIVDDDDENGSVYTSAGSPGASDAGQEESYMEEYFDAANSPEGVTTTAAPATTISTTEDASSTFAPTRNRLIGIVDWVLGVDSDDSLFAYYAEAQQKQQQQQQRRRAQEQARALAAIPSACGNGISPLALKKRDEEQGLNLDVALVLGALSLLVDGVS